MKKGQYQNKIEMFHTALEETLNQHERGRENYLHYQNLVEEEDKKQCPIIREFLKKNSRYGKEADTKIQK